MLSLCGNDNTCAEMDVDVCNEEGIYAVCNDAPGIKARRHTNECNIHRKCQCHVEHQQAAQSIPSANSLQPLCLRRVSSSNFVTWLLVQKRDKQKAVTPVESDTKAVKGHTTKLNTWYSSVDFNGLERLKCELELTWSDI